MGVGLVGIVERTSPGRSTDVKTREAMHKQPARSRLQKLPPPAQHHHSLFSGLTYTELRILSPQSTTTRTASRTVARRSTFTDFNSKHVFVQLSSLFSSSPPSSRLVSRPLFRISNSISSSPSRCRYTSSRTSPRPAAAMAYHDDDPGSQLSSELTSLSTSRESSPLSSVGGRRTPSPPPEIHLSDALHTMYPKARTLSRIDPSLPTPPPSQENSQSGSPAPDAADSSMLSDKDAPPPAKRRRVGPKERTTRSLDLRHEHVNSCEQSQFDDMLRALHKRQKIVVVAGAGISVAAGSA